MDTNVNSNDTFRAIGAEVVEWLEAKKPQYTKEIIEEISKLHEEAVRGTLEEVIAHFTETEPRGEIVIVLAGLED